MDGAYALGVILTILGGIALAVQSGVNATLARAAESRSFASAVSFALGLLVCVGFFLVDSFALKSSLPSAASIKAAPWWAWIGGVLGAFYVIVVIIFAQKLGAGTIVAIFVTSQLLTSVVLDLTGLVGFNRRQVSWPRLLGAALMVMGVALVTTFPGEPLSAVHKRQLLAQQAAEAAAAGGSRDASGSSSSSSMQHSMVELAAAEAGVRAMRLFEAGAGDATAMAQPRPADAVIKVL